MGSPQNPVVMTPAPAYPTLATPGYTLPHYSYALTTPPTPHRTWGHPQLVVLAPLATPVSFFQTSHLTQPAVLCFGGLAVLNDRT